MTKCEKDIFSSLEAEATQVFNRTLTIHECSILIVVYKILSVANPPRLPPLRLRFSSSHLARKKFHSSQLTAGKRQEILSRFPLPYFFPSSFPPSLTARLHFSLHSTHTISPPQL
uniref:Uncharacterized protein n=1 Tax=Palpitomonas bilix TaxID=652834 RepID=A0A7S3G7Z3_9EUKA|mmetsp:Transcript_34145/g.88148  ORF Transcript_34145/g.88148 Transcript_34145/m.88148 type:complete len:115 (+) Transcript_34145:890-1234(+)